MQADLLFAYGRNRFSHDVAHVCSITPILAISDYFYKPIFHVSKSLCSLAYHTSNIQSFNHVYTCASIVVKKDTVIKNNINFTWL